FHCRNIGKLLPMLTFSVAGKLINTFVFSRLDYCNALLAGVPKATLSKLQLVQNSAARILTGTSAREHITPILEKLHWLPVSFRIDWSSHCPKTRLKTVGDRAFSSLAPKLCNSLPLEIRNAGSLGVFKSHLKTYFFRLAL
ncbi:hypothetical protein C0J50_23927, partial [Silurus asotus]